MKSMTIEPVENLGIEEVVAVPDVIEDVVEDVVTEKKFICQECSARYEKYGSLVNHLRAKHDKSPGNELLKCDQCEKLFDSVKKLNRHKKTHKS